MKSIHLATAILVLTFTSFCEAETYYVSSSNGKDNRTNNAARNRSTPWRTIQHALDSVGEGDEIVVRDGTYREHAEFQSGEVTLRSENIHGARVIGSISGSDSNYVTVSGFDVTNEGDTEMTKGIAFFQSHHVTVRSNLVRNCYGGGIGVDKSDWILIEWNITHNNAYFDVNQHSGISVYQPQYRGIDDDRTYGVIIRNNTSYGNWNYVDNPDFDRPTDGNGIVMDDFKNTQPGGGVSYDRMTIVENNLCFNNGGQGIHTYESQNIRIRNNTCVNNMGSFEFGGEISISSSERVYAFNNILVARSGKKAALQFDSSNFWVGFNVIDGPTQGLPTDPSNFYESAQFEPGTFELKASSPAVDSGIDVGDHYLLDVNGQNRTNGPIDIGAIER